MRNWLESALVCSLLAAAACGKGVTEDPLVACGADGSCPAGFVCASDRTCWKPPAAAPPAKPANVRAVRGAGGVTVSWDASAHTANYLVVRTTTASAGVPFTFAPTTATSLVDGSALHGESYTYVVHATGPNGDTPSAPAFVGAGPVPPPPPSFLQISAGIRHVQLSWNANFFSEVGVFRSSTTGGPYVLLATVKPGVGSYDDTALADGTRYFFVLEALATDGFPGDASQEVSATTAPAAPTGLTATLADLSNRLTLTWDPVPGAAGYCVKLLGTFPCNSPNTQTNSFATDLQAGNTYDIRVSSLAPPGGIFSPFLEGPDAGPIHVIAPLPAPSPLIITPAGFTGFTLGWPAVPGATSYVVLRATASTPAEQIGTTADTTFSDVNLQEWSGYAYQVASVDASNRIGAPGFQIAAQTFAPADQKNLGTQATLVATSLDLTHEAGQTFTVGQAGLLAGIELSETALDFGFPLPILELYNGPQLVATTNGSGVPFGTCCSPLTDGPPGRAFFQFSAVPVSVGQTLRFRVRPPQSFFVNNSVVPTQLARTGDDYAGGSFFSAGEPDLTSDLLFKTFVRPPTTPATSMGLPTAFPRVRQLALAWDALPSATSYSVLQSNLAGGPFVVIATTVQTNFVVDSLTPGSSAFYEVRATGASGTTTTSAVQAGPLGSDVDQANAGDGSGFALVDELHGAFAGQSFTVSKAGTLAAVQLSALAANGGTIGFVNATVNVLDDAGAILIQQPVTLEVGGGCCGVAGPPPIDPASPALQTVDLSAFHRPVSPGQVLRIEIHSFSPLQIGDSGDLYGGGTEFVNGTAIPGRDLAFQVLVQ